MPKSLVLAEKPSVAREIARVLGCRQNGQGFISGDRYIVTWALGHLVTLADPELYDKRYQTWSLETLPMLPQRMQLVVIKESSHQFKIVKGLMDRADVSDIVIATDSGREGELVARWIMIKAGCKKPAKRLWISSQTDRAVKDGFNNLRPAAEYYNLFLSAQSRSEADWLVGLNVTRALTCKHNAQLSAGRVQTPTLAMIVEREQEIKRFVPKDFFTVKAQFDGLYATWMNTDKQSRMFDRAAAEAIVKRVQGKQGTVAEVTKQYKHKAPPAAYDLTELQRDANRKYAYSAKDTLAYTQALYERHKLLTYPRTDSRYVTDDIAATLSERLKSMAVGPYAELARGLLRSRPLSTRYILDNSKVTDHHAIIPTDEPLGLGSLTPEERNIYDLVARRFLAVLMPAFEYEEIKVTVRIDRDCFYARGKTIKSMGWKSAYGSAVGSEDEEDAELREQLLPQLRQGQRLNLKLASVETGKTKPPARYTEATLLTAMENPADRNMRGELREVLKATSGLGTPATRADIIEKLFSAFYIERRGKELVPTSKGVQLVSIVPEELRSAELTAKWEQELAQISKGQVKSDAYIERMRAYAAKLVSMVIASDTKYVHDNVSREKCPDCGKFLLDVKGKRGAMRVCPDRECGYRKSVAVQTNARCPNCNKRLDLRGEGEKRLFVCVCGFREKLSDFEKRRQESGANKRDVQKYLENQRPESGGVSDMARQLAEWMEKNKK